MSQPNVIVSQRSRRGLRSHVTHQRGQERIGLQDHEKVSVRRQDRAGCILVEAVAQRMVSLPCGQAIVSHA
jgi:hypothetical protein